jgi:tetratricopeptide (TPR) repeat protein
VTLSASWAILGTLALGSSATVEGRFASATLDNGLSVGFTLVRTDQVGPEADTSIGEVALARSNAVSRVLVDSQSGAYFGYRLTAVPVASGRVRLAFQPLADDVEAELRRRQLPCTECPAPTRLAVAAARFPGPQVVGDGEALSLELLSNPTTGGRILDVVKVSARPLSAESMRPAVDLTLEAWRAGVRASTLLARRQYPAALAEYEKALELTPRDAVLHNKLGVCYQHMGRDDGARRAYDRALALNPRYAEAWNNLGTLEQAAGRLKQAIRAYRKAVELKPGAATPWKNLGSAYLTQGSVEQGLAAYRRAFELDPTILEPRSGPVASGVDAATLDYYLAKMFASNGQAELALEFLLKAEAGGFADWGKVAGDPDFKLLADGARFQQLLRDHGR